MSALVRIAEDRVLADSRDVATEFGRAHKSVLRAITMLLKSTGELERNFAPTLYQVPGPQGAVRQTPRYDMDRKVFMLLVMGFTGAKALAMKIRFIDAFDAMEQMLRTQIEADNDDELPVGALPSLSEAGRICALGEVYRRIYGVAEARWIMQKYGLPVPPAVLATSAALPLGNNVTDWFEQCCIRDEHGREGAAELYSSYSIWCSEQQQVAETQTGFGRSLGRLGFPSHRSNRVWRRGIRLL